VTEGHTTAQPIRGTQKLVDQMGWVIRRPVLTLLEVAWRWLFGIPLLIVSWRQAQQILAAVPPASAGADNLDTLNPWIAGVQFGNVWAHYSTHVSAVLHWLAPVAIVVWVIVSAAGRAVVFRRLDPGVRFRPFAMLPLQAAWLLVLAGLFWCWLRSMHWVAATHIVSVGDADLVGYSIWAIFLSLGFFSFWAVLSWPVTIAPVLMLFENRSAFSALAESFNLRRTFTSKVMEVNLVMGIIKLSIIVLAMVFSAAPLPFADELGPTALRLATACALGFYLVANDYFQLVRLKSFVEFWRIYRGHAIE